MTQELYTAYAYMVIQNFFIVGICALFHGVADMCFPLYAHCIDPVILWRQRGTAGVQIDVWIFRYDFGFFILYFSVRFAIEIPIVDLTVYISTLHIPGFPTAIFSFSNIFTSSWHIDLLNITNFLYKFRPFF